MPSNKVTLASTVEEVWFKNLNSCTSNCHLCIVLFHLFPCLYTVTWKLEQSLLLAGTHQCLCKWHSESGASGDSGWLVSEADIFAVPVPAVRAREWGTADVYQGQAHWKPELIFHWWSPQAGRIDEGEPYVCTVIEASILCLKHLWGYVPLSLVGRVVEETSGVAVQFLTCWRQDITTF